MIGLDFGFKKIKRAQILRKPWKKKNTNNGGVNKYSGLSKKEEFLLEKTCLKKINKNFKCLCKNKSSHFPSTINSSNDELLLTNRGVSLNKYKDFVKNKEIDPISISNLDEQINCILDNLKKNNIKHLDMCLDGKNLCLSKTGVLSLIDFNIACIDNKYTTNKIKNRLNHYGNDIDSYNKFMKNSIIQIIKNTM